MIIKGAKVYTEEGTFAEKEVCTEGEVFTETSGDGEKVVDGSGCYLIPGLTDIHFMDAWERISVTERKNPFR